MSTRQKNSPPSANSSLGELAAWGRRELAGASSSPRLDAELLLAYAVARPRSSIHAFPEKVVTGDAAERFRELVEERRVGVPLAYLTGSKEFRSLDFNVSRATLVPRPETELLVELALEHIDETGTAAALDLGTGCGAVALALKHARPECRVTAVDSSSAALAVASANAAHLELDVRWLLSDWFDALSGERFGLIVGNPPYVASRDFDRSPELSHEPRAALDGGSDGLDAIRTILAQAIAYLEPGGTILLEHGFDQGTAVADLALASGFDTVAIHTDLAGLDRVLVASRTAGGDAA